MAVDLCTLRRSIEIERGVQNDKMRARSPAGHFVQFDIAVRRADPCPNPAEGTDGRASTAREMAYNIMQHHGDNDDE